MQDTGKSGCRASAGGYKTVEGQSGAVESRWNGTDPHLERGKGNPLPSLSSVRRLRAERNRRRRRRWVHGGEDREARQSTGTRW